MRRRGRKGRMQTLLFSTTLLLSSLYICLRACVLLLKGKTWNSTWPLYLVYITTYGRDTDTQAIKRLQGRSSSSSSRVSPILLGPESCMLFSSQTCMYTEKNLHFSLHPKRGRTVLYSFVFVSSSTFFEEANFVAVLPILCLFRAVLF